MKRKLYLSKINNLYENTQTYNDQFCNHKYNWKIKGRNLSIISDIGFISSFKKP